MSRWSPYHLKKKHSMVDVVVRRFRRGCCRCSSAIDVVCGVTQTASSRSDICVNTVDDGGTGKLWWSEPNFHSLLSPCAIDDPHLSLGRIPTRNKRRHTIKFVIVDCRRVGYLAQSRTFHRT